MRPGRTHALVALAFASVLSAPVAHGLGALTLPTFSPANFTPGAPIDNPYFPLKPGTLNRYGGTVTDPDTGLPAFESFTDRVTFRTEVVGGVTARVVEAKSFLDGLLVEDTIDWYAQDKAGNVWYLGERTKAFEYDDDGNLVGTDTAGSWRTGVNGAKPGFIMPASPTVGFSYYQEFAPADDALDQAKVLSLGGSLTGPLGTFNGVLTTEETTAVEPDVLEHKKYAPGVGLVRVEEDFDAGGRPAATFDLLETRQVPLPPAAAAGLLAGVPLIVATRKHAGRGRRRR